MSFKKGIFFTLFVCWVALISAQTDTNIDSLIQEMKKETDPCQKSFRLTVITSRMRGIDLEKAISYALEGLQLAKKHDCENRGRLYADLGFFYNEKAQHQEALSYLDSSLVYYQSVDDVSSTIRTYGYIAGVYYSLSDYALATQYAYKGIELNKVIKDSSNIVQLQNLLAVCYTSQGEYQKALKASKYVLNIYEKNQNFSNNEKAIILYNIGIIYEQLNQLDSAILSHQKALAIHLENNNVYGIVTTYIEQATIYRDQGKINKAFDIMRAVDSLRADISTIAETQVTIDRTYGSIYQANKEYEKAIPLYQKALAKSREHKNKLLEHSVLSKLVACYQGLNNFEQAFIFQKQAFDINDSIFNEKKQKQIKALEIKYETKEKEQENKTLKSERDLIALKSQRRLYWIIVSFVVLILVTTISFLIVRNNKEKSERKTSQLKNQLLRNQMNPHFIFNSLFAIQSFVYQNKPKEAGKYLSSFAKLTRAVLENSRHEFISLAKEIEWLENYMHLQSLRFQDQFDFKIELAEDIDPETLLIPPMLTQPFIENALEHGIQSVEYKGEIYIRFYLKDKHLEIVVEDNGTGIQNKDLAKKSTHESLALEITQERLRLLNSKRKQKKVHFYLGPRKPKGTIVSFKIPIHE